MITTNSLGQRIAKTDEQIRAFWRWFGDSKVVDEQGRPLVVYHSGGFNAEDDPEFRTNGGAHFGTLRAAEERMSAKPVDDFISEASIEFDEEYGAWFWSSQGVDSFDLNEGGFQSEEDARADLERQAMQQNDNDFGDDTGSTITAVYLNIRKPRKSEDMKDDWSEAVEDAQDADRDGIKYINRFEDKGSTSWIAFDPTQIKSATGNRGTFDPADPMITNPPLLHEPTHLAGMRILRGFRPATQQHEHTCGPACLRAVLAHYAQNADEADLARAAGTTKANGTTPAGMLRVLRASRPVVVMKRGATVAWCLRQLRQSRPVLLLWNDWEGHWVVLIGYDPKTRRLLLADPANRRTGLRVHTPATLNRHWKARVGSRVYRRLAIAVG